MLRITELRLPLDHAEAALRLAVVARLGVADADLLSFQVFRRAWDARRKSAILLIYTIDCEVRDEVAVLAAHPGDPHLKPAPDTRYRFVGHAPADFSAQQRPRPVVVGFGPCGIFAALVLAQMGLRPIVLERGREVRQRTKDTWGLWRRGELRCRLERAVRRRRRRHLQRRQAVEPDQRPAPPHPQGADRVRQGRRARGDPLRQQAAHRHLPAGEHGDQDARRDRGARRRDPLRPAADGPAARTRR